MKKAFASILLLAFFGQNGFSQTNTVLAPSIGFSIIGNDYKTAERIRATSLNTVLREKSASSFKEMGIGLALHYIKGFTSHIDFRATAGGSFVKLSLPGKRSAQDDFLLEVDASAHFKMFTETAAVVNPYLIAGIGASKYTNVYGAIIPLGGGIKLNLFNEAQFFTEYQYRVPVTTEANQHHFQVSFGVAALL